MVGNFHHHAHVVLDQQDADADVVADRQQQPVELVRLARIEPGRRLVEAQELGIRAHGAGDLEPALGAIGQVGGGIVGPLDQPDALEPLHRLLRRLALGAAIGRQPQYAGNGEAGRPHQRVVLRHDQILQHRHAGEQADVLEGPRHLRPLRDPKIVHPLEQKARAVLMRERDPAFGRLVEAGDAVEQGGLAGAIGADDGGDVARLGREAEIADGGETAEAHRQMLDREQRIRHHPRPSATSSPDTALRSLR